jgi:hypothetical protein
MVRASGLRAARQGKRGAVSWIIAEDGCDLEKQVIAY